MKSHITFYGSLRRSHPMFYRLKLDEHLRFVSRCKIHGRLYDLGSYPGLTIGGGKVAGELYEVINEDCIKRLDTYEGFSTASKHSLYIRRHIRLIAPQVYSWVYIYNHNVLSTQLISCGDWNKYLNAKQKVKTCL